MGKRRRGREIIVCKLEENKLDDVKTYRSWGRRGLYEQKRNSGSNGSGGEFHDD